MIEAFIYVLLQCLGYRLICFDWALNRGIPLTGYEYWAWYPWWKMGTYREVSPKKPYLYCGFGPDK